MKRKYLAVILIGIMVLSLLGGCSNDSDDESVSSDSNTIYGEVSAVGEDSITNKVGTMKEKEKASGLEKSTDGGKISELAAGDETAATYSPTENGDEQIE